MKRLLRDGNWTWAASLAAIGFIAGGLSVFYLGLRAAAPPPPPPGTVNCGNQALGGLILMSLGAPLAACVSAILAGALGGLVDCLRRWFADSANEVGD